MDDHHALPDNGQWLFVRISTELDWFRQLA
jgi:hypothetical protein